jgi:hypothetical protein
MPHAPARDHEIFGFASDQKFVLQYDNNTTTDASDL